ncbi:MAG: SecD/SecF family protein translocase subunit [Eubacteriales bacterium]|nr:SecD/SecF family protein translocase subunit [Eubacteriales bacterium]
MNKKKSIVIFTLISVLLILGAVFAFIPTFQIGNSVYDYTGYARSIKLGLDLAGGVSAVFDVKAPEGEDLTADEMRVRLDGVKSSMEDLLTSKGYTESVVTYNATGANPTITVEIPDVDDPERVFDLIGRPASLKITKGDDADTVYIVGSKHLSQVGVAADTEKNNGTYVISLQFNKEGTTAFATATKDNVGSNLDIYINGEKLMSVSVSSEISNGQAVIKQGGSTSGGYTYEEAYDMATRLQAGTFGVDMTVRETNILSPTLGTTAIRSSLIAGLVGLLLVMIFMVAFYGMFGLMADLALIAYTELVLFLCAILPWVQLTLPGIAGIIIGIGMAVDANILIFERIKDEYRSGLLGTDDLFLKPQRGSDGKITSQGGPISRGFRKAAVAVIDSNVTTLIGAIVMWIFGSTSIVGFAVTLFISIIVSMFTALFITRMNISLLGAFDNMNNPKFYMLKRNKEAE